MKTFLANLKRAARNREVVIISGGEFSHEDCQPVIDTIEHATVALERIVTVLDARTPKTSIEIFALAEARLAVSRLRSAA